MSSTSLVAAAIVGVSTHFVLSPIPEVSTIKVLSAYLIANASLLCYLITAGQTAAASSSLQSLVAGAIIHLIKTNFVFLVSSISLTLVRRLYFSPLSRFPGPKLAALSKLWAANQYRLGLASKTYRDLHEIYKSDVVRIGPNEVSIACVEAIDKIFKGRYARGTFYEVGALNGEFNLNTRRDYKFHPAWRRIWEKAFVSNEFKEYNPRVERHVQKLLGIIRDTGGRTANCYSLMGHLTFDVMSDLCFSKDTGMQDGTGDPLYMNFLHKYVSSIGVVGSLRNLCQLLLYFPETADLKAFREKGEAMLAERQQLGTTTRDIFHHLLAQDSESGCQFTQAELNSNANLAIVAGADTTASTLTQTFWKLCGNPRILRRLQHEVDEAWEREGRLSVETTRGLPYLNAVVNEALRMLSPVPSGAQATTPPSGVEIKGFFIPGNVQVVVSQLGLMTDERYFVNADEFWPERWLDEAAGVKDKRAWIPFGYGVHSCVGKPLALNELRLVVANVVREFDLEFGDGFSQEKFVDEWKDYMVLSLGPLPMKFLPRSSA